MHRQVMTHINSHLIVDTQDKKITVVFVFSVYDSGADTRDNALHVFVNR